MWALLRETGIGARFGQRLTERRRRRATEGWAAASDDALRDEYAQLCLTDEHLGAAVQALRDASEHAGHVPYSGPWRDRMRRLERRLDVERSARNENTIELEAEMYRRWGLASGQSFGPWIRALRTEALGEPDERA
jgi:hypothetical protein